MNQVAAPSPAVPMLPYVGWFALIFVGGIAVLLSVLLLLNWTPQAHLDVAIIFGAGTTAHWRFLKKHRRRFTRGEFWRVVSGSTAVSWAVSLAIGVWFVAAAGRGEALASPLFWGLSLVLTLPFDLLSVCAAYSVGGKQMLERELRKEQSSPVAPIEPR